MKKVTVCILMMIPFIGFGQKKENGKIYIEHPAINVVAAFTKAWVAGDTTAMGKLMTNDFRSFSAVGSTPFDKGSDKSTALRGAKLWSEQLDYFSVITAEGSYPDAFEYTKDPSDNNAVTVETWEVLKGVHKKTGVKADMYLHKSYTLTKDNKIRRILMYNNPEIGTKIGQAMSVRKNGTIYNEHTNINTLRKMMGAIENSDSEKYYSFYDSKATFLDSNDPTFKTYNLDTEKTKNKAALDLFEIKGIEQVGYPDYLEYEMGNTSGKEGVLYSWWNFHLTRKSDKKAIMLPMHYQHNVNEEGKIVHLTSYFNAELLK